MGNAQAFSRVFICVDRRQHPLEAIDDSGAVSQPIEQRQANNLWPRLPALQQPACIDRIGELCASLRRGIVPLLHTGTPVPSSSCMGDGGRRRHRAANLHPPRGHRPVLPLDELNSQGGGATQPEQPCEAGSPFEDVPQAAIPSTSSVTAEAQRCGATLPQAPVEASSGAGASAATAVPAQRSSSCSGEAAAAGPTRSPGDRTDSDDEGVRRRGRSPTEAQRAASGHAAAQEAGTSAAGSEAERQPGGAPSGTGASAGGACDGAVAVRPETPSPEQVCRSTEGPGARRSGTGLLAAIVPGCPVAAAGLLQSSTARVAEEPTRRVPSCRWSPAERLHVSQSKTAPRWMAGGLRQLALCMRCTTGSQPKRWRCEALAWTSSRSHASSSTAADAG